MRWKRKTRATVGVLLAGVILALGLALPGVSALAEGAADAPDMQENAPFTAAAEPMPQSDTPAVQADTATGTYDIYWYALIPGQTMDSDQDPNSTWFGLGVSSISGVQDPSSYSAGEVLTSYGAISRTATKKVLFPDITVENTTYKYAAPGSGHEYEKGYYTLTPIRVVSGEGANAGNNNYNPTVNSGTRAFHYDNVITLNEKDILSVNFEVEDPASKTWSALEKYAQRVKSGYAESSLKRPTVGPDVASTKTVDGVTYDFDGWFTDKDCTSRADFTGAVTSNTVYYGHYVPRLGNLSIAKTVSGSAANAGEHFTFELTCTALAGKSFGVEGLATDEVAHSSEVIFGQDGIATLQLKHGEVATIKNLPAGVTVSVRETGLSGNAKTSTTATVNGGQATEVKAASSTATQTDPISAGVSKGETTELSFLNTAEIQPSTGVSVNAAPMAALLCVTVAGGTALAVQRKRQHDARKE